MTTFYICRHGQTENNKRGKHQGWIDTPLTEDGIAHAKSTGRKLLETHLDLIVSSDLGRAFMTAYIISRLIGYQEEILRSNKLREINYGDLANTPYEAFPDVKPEDMNDFTPPNGESLIQMQSRVMREVASLSKEYPGKTILIAGHDGTINAIRAYFSKETIAKANRVSNAHDYIAEFEVEEGHVRSFAEFAK